MVTVEWIDRQLTVAVEPGERLLDAIDEYPQSGTSWGCRSGHCGSCRVRVVDDPSAAVVPAGEEEQETLRELGAGADERLACQIEISGKSRVPSRTVRLIAVPSNRGPEI